VISSKEEIPVITKISFDKGSSTLIKLDKNI
jgi:hypothetical protein